MLTKHRKVRAILNSVIALALMLTALLTTMESVSAGSLPGPTIPTITLSESGFEPRAITVVAGTQVEEKQPSESKQLTWWGWPKGPETKIAFHSGYQCSGRACYTNWLKISGFDEDDIYAEWDSSWKREPLGTIRNDEIEMKPNRGILLEFHISGFGRRECYVDPSGSRFMRWMHVTYDGNNTCSYRFSPYKWN